jgi:hypothetical protein
MIIEDESLKFDILYNNNSDSLEETKVYKSDNSKSDLYIKISKSTEVTNIDRSLSRTTYLPFDYAEKIIKDIRKGNIKEYNQDENIISLFRKNCEELIVYREKYSNFVTVCPVCENDISKKERILSTSNIDENCKIEIHYNCKEEFKKELKKIINNKKKILSEILSGN